MAPKTADKLPSPPKSLGKAGRSFWQAVTADWVLDARGLELLALAAQQLDRIAAAQAAVAGQGPFVANKQGRLAEHPGLHTERQASVIFLRASRELGLDLQAPPQVLRGPRRPGTRN